MRQPQISPHTIRPRQIGRVDAPHPGPTVIVIGAIHGNEPAGVEAAHAVLARLEAEPHWMHRGRVVGLVGNRKALTAGLRGQEEDLNRAWTPERLAAARLADPRRDGPEQAELRALLARLDALFDTATGPVLLLDLHTTSGGGPPFSVAPDTLAARRLALALPFPMILGLLESVHGTTIEFATRRGHTGLAVETGQHRDPNAVRLHEATIWRVLHAAGCLDAEPPEVGAALAAVDPDLPAVVELLHHHGVEPGDGFRMRPGYEGFQPVRAGEVLADDIRGPIIAPANGRILMPLYQDQGSDGFFVVRDVRRRWLMASSMLRRAGGARLIPQVLGARAVSADGMIFVNPPGKRTRALLRLLGYRRSDQDTGHTRLHRMREPAEPPRRRK